MINLAKWCFWLVGLPRFPYYDPESSRSDFERILNLTDLFVISGVERLIDQGKPPLYDSFAPRNDKETFVHEFK